MAVIMNLTPHTISIVNQNNEIVNSFESHGIARVATTASQVGEIDGIPVNRTVFGEVQGLPEPQEDTVYIVSMVVAQAASGRKDVVAPDTGPTAYRQNGQIVGVRAFVQY